MEEPIHFIEGRPVDAEKDSYYDLPGRSEESASLYEHCVRAITRGFRLGEHGLPLIGSGDWNDGMNLVGEHGKGESVWLGFSFMKCSCSSRRLPVRGVITLSSNVARGRRLNCAAISMRMLDGGWYRRAYFDDGSPLGSASNPECQIDSIAQSWSVLSGAGDAGALVWPWKRGQAPRAPGPCADPTAGSAV